MSNILEASGAHIRPECMKFNNDYNITDFGADCEASPAENTAAINAAIAEAAQAGGGNVIVPAGEFRTYTIKLKSNVNLRLEKGSVIRAARTDIKHSYVSQKGEGGNYDEPEINRYAGLQDHGHTYFANSLIYGYECTNIMISGCGLIDGSSINDETGKLEYVLLGGDPQDGAYRSRPGHKGEWFGNKAIALVDCSNVVLKDFNLTIGGHFAVITEGVTDLYIEGLLVDTNRDALDIDCCQDVTVRNCHFNSLTDDALVLKSSFGAGKFMPIKNILIEDCKVSGYDAGSVYAGTYTCEKLVAEDRCRPTGRVKLGTESSCGYHQVTIRRVAFDHSRGFALEAVDGSDLTDIIFTDCSMKHISSSPVFIRVGDRCRFPVTGVNKGDAITPADADVRIDNKNFIIPDTDEYEKYPAVRYTPAYNRSRRVTADGHSWFYIVDEKNPVIANPVNYAETDGHFYALKYSREKGYQADMTREITKREAYLRANACSRELPVVKNIEISNVKVVDADPRYPMLIAGLDGACVENVIIKNISVTYCGGMSMKDAVQQRQINTNWEYQQYKTLPSVQSIPWMVNTFFLKNEGLLPRADWDKENSCWKDDPYNVPEMPAAYPEPSIFGILPAYGLYARHVRKLQMENITFELEQKDSRHAIVLDDAEHISLKKIKQEENGIEPVAFVTNLYKRPAGFEYAPDEPYHMTAVKDAEIDEGIAIKLVTVEAPAPGTPLDSLYNYPTVPCTESGYCFDDNAFGLPKNVYKPFISVPATVHGKAGAKLEFAVKLKDPYSQTSTMQTPGKIYNESQAEKEYTVYTPETQKRAWKVSCKELFENASFDSETGTFSCVLPETPGIFNISFEASADEYGSLEASVKIVSELV